MNTYSKTKSIYSIHADVTAKKITFDSYLQRKAGQWSSVQKGKLIDSILRDYPIPAVYAVAPSAGSQKMSIIDGCQRINTICDFIDGKFSLSIDLKPVVVDGEEVSIARRKFNGLPQALKDKIHATEISIVTLTECTNDDIVAVFDRLNGGTPLSPAQKNKVNMSFEFADHIRKIAEMPTLTKYLTATQTKRDTNQSVVLESLMLLTPEYAYGSVGGAELKKFSKFYDAIYKPEKLERLEMAIVALGNIIPDDCKTIKKVMIPGIITAIEPHLENEEVLEAFKGELAKFLADPTSNADYMQYATLHTTSKANVDGRIGFFKSLI